MLRKILIANRGEIAVRIIRACAEMGIRSVAIYSEADRFALHVKKADESYCIGSEPLAGYLNAYGLVNLAATTNCDAIHPGYGFLSENAQFARACKERGIIFIGPEADVIHRMGDKTEARKAMAIENLKRVIDVLQAFTGFARTRYRPDREAVMLWVRCGGGCRYRFTSM